MSLDLRRRLRDLAGLDDPPAKIGMGLALGIFVGFLPIMGIQMAVVLPFALLFRGNTTAAVAGVWITNPVTVIPIYYVDYKVGLIFTQHPPLSRSYFVDLFRHMSAAKFIQLGSDIVVPLVAGGVVLGVLFCVPTYFLTKALIVRYRLQKQKLKEALAAKLEPFGSAEETSSVKLVRSGLEQLARDGVIAAAAARPRASSSESGVRPLPSIGGPPPDA